MYSNWEIANTWQIKTSKYSCDLNKTAHLVAISWTLADIHGQWVRRSFTHINSAHNTTPPLWIMRLNQFIKVYILSKSLDLHIHCKCISTFTFYLKCKKKKKWTNKFHFKMYWFYQMNIHNTCIWCDIFSLLSWADNFCTGLPSSSDYYFNMFKI